MLSQIGWITIPTDIANKVATNKPLSAEETARFRQHPAAAARIIERIPRLETVAKIIEAQLAPRAAQDDPVQFGAAILQVAVDFDGLQRCGLSHSAALTEMRLHADLYHPDVMSAMTRLEEVQLAERTRIVPVGSLAPGMILEQDICVRSGMCLIGSGQLITATLLERLQGFSHAMDAGLMVSVRVPEASVL